MSRSKQRTRQVQNLERDELTQHIEQLTRNLRIATESNIILRRTRDAQDKELDRLSSEVRFWMRWGDSLERQVTELKESNRQLQTYVDAAELQAKTWEAKWLNLWKHYERVVKQASVLKCVATDVYDFCFEDDRQAEVRRLRRVLKVLGAKLYRQDETPNKVETA